MLALVACGSAAMGWGAMWSRAARPAALAVRAPVGSSERADHGRATFVGNGAPGRIRTLDPQFRRLAVLATREPCRPARSREGSAASCRSVTSASISGRRRQRKSRSLLSVASRSKELLNEESSCHPGFFPHHSLVRGRGGPVGSSFRGLGPAHMAMPQADVLTASSSRDGERFAAARDLVGCMRPVLATCSQHAANTAPDPALSQFWPLGTNSERIRNVWNSRGTNPELSVNA